MARYIISILLFLHGIIHIIGFVKAFSLAPVPQVTKLISKPHGILWLLAALLFVLAAILCTLRKDWWMFAVPAIILSQYLITSIWADAKFGTIANIILLAACVLSFGTWRFERRYLADVRIANESTQTRSEILSEQDLIHLPLPVAQYLRYVGVIGKSKVHSYFIKFDGRMRDKGKDWFPFSSEQHNFIDPPARLFFMNARMFGTTVPGYHAYKNGSASMEVKPFGFVPVVDVKPGVLNKAETVTLLNDMCILAPATLIDKRISWMQINDSFAKAIFTVNDLQVSAILYFNAQHQLVNFVSDDRYAIAEQRQFRFSTPLSDYKNFKGYNLASYGKAVWHYPDSEFVYGEFHLQEVQYNR
jgi:hypothetical protein